MNELEIRKVIEEELGNADGARTYYRLIYEADISYRDIAQQIEGQA